MGNDRLGDVYGEAASCSVKASSFYRRKHDQIGGDKEVSKALTLCAEGCKMARDSRVEQAEAIISRDEHKALNRELFAGNLMKQSEFRDKMVACYLSGTSTKYWESANNTNLNKWNYEKCFLNAKKNQNSEKVEKWSTVLEKQKQVQEYAILAAEAKDAQKWYKPWTWFAPSLWNKKARAEEDSVKTYMLKHGL